ncbi:MAG: hypothetical protein ACRCX8_20295 [Sarcina sp.]
MKELKKGDFLRNNRNEKMYVVVSDWEEKMEYCYTDKEAIKKEDLIKNFEKVDVAVRYNFKEINDNLMIVDKKILLKKAFVGAEVITTARNTFIKCRFAAYDEVQEAVLECSSEIEGAYSSEDLYSLCLAEMIRVIGLDGPFTPVSLGQIKISNGW